MKELINLINNTYPLSKNTFEKLMGIVTTQTYPPKYKLAEIGKKTYDIYFLFSGIVRSYIISPKGKESNSSLFYKETYISSFSSLINKTPSSTTIECLTDCKIAKCNYDNLIKLADQYNDLNLAYIKSIENLIILTEERDIEFATLTATERYLALKHRVPKIDNLISQKHIASHLGITPVQLSRLKKKLLQS